MKKQLWIALGIVFASLLFSRTTIAHPGGHGEARGSAAQTARISRAVNSEAAVEAMTQAIAVNRVAAPEKQNSEAPKPIQAQHFAAFDKSLQLKWDQNYLYVGSNGLPDHPLMVGIRAWQQQVPLPQKYFGENAWRVPLHPVPARDPMSAKNHFLRGAIALAINGVPIFNPLNNRGDDAFLIGELDEFGGHCGRADDYHYHLPPVHLQKFVGRDQPIAYALDGYPIYGFVDDKCADCGPLDWLNGHKDKAGKYHYHSTKKYPYMNGGFYGQVVEREGQVDPQPRANGVRPALTPLRDAKITAFTEWKPGSYRLTYDVRGKAGTVSYSLIDDGSVKFEFVDPSGKKTEETYAPRRRGPGGGGGETGKGPPREGKGKGPPREEARPRSAGEGAAPAAGAKGKLQVSSESVDKRGFIAVACTCDGGGQTPAVSWSDVPAGTKCLAVSVWHTAPDQEKSYWLVYNIPATVAGWKANEAPRGTVGLNDKRKATYDPMCSKGPGVKEYHVTVFALSQELTLTADKATRANLLTAIKNITLAEGTLTFKHERK